jgi:hypothetical protein
MHGRFLLIKVLKESLFRGTKPILVSLKLKLYFTSFISCCVGLNCLHRETEKAFRSQSWRWSASTAHVYSYAHALSTPYRIVVSSAARHL